MQHNSGNNLAPMNELKIIKLFSLLSSNFLNMDSKDFFLTINNNMTIIADFFDIDRVILYSLDPDLNFSLFEYKKEKYPSHCYLTKNEIPKTFPWLISELNRNQPRFFKGIEQLPQDAKTEISFLENEGIASIIWVPIFFQNTLYAFLEFTNFSDVKNWEDFPKPLFLNLASIFFIPLVRKKNEEKVASLYTSLDQKINEKENELTTLLNMQKVLTTELHIDHVIQLIADEARRLTNTKLSTVCLLETGKLILRVASGDNSDQLTIGYEIPLDRSFSEFYFRIDSPIFVDDTENASGVFSEILKLTKSKSILIIPLVSGREPIGILSVSDKENGILGYEEARLLKMFANIAIIALENARIYRQEQKRREEAENGKKIAEALRDILRVLNSKMALEQVLAYIALQSKELLKSSSTMIRKINYENATVITEASSNLPDEFAIINEMPFYPGGSERVLRENKPVFVSNLNESLGRYLNDPQELSSPQQEWAKIILKHYRSQLIVPLIINEHLYGTLTFYYVSPTDFTEEEIHLGMTLGTQVSLAIENARLRDHEKEIAIATERNRLARDLHDAVTQTLFSATLIAEVLPKVWEKNKSEGEKRLEELRQLTRGALAEMRTLLLELRPSALMDASYTELLRQLCDALKGRTRIPIELDIKFEPILPVEIKTAFYRITQEAFNNIAKHANATQVSVRLYQQTNSVVLEIEDNGKGMNEANTPSNHFGLGFMKERAINIHADLNIISKLGVGTVVKLIWNKSFTDL